MTNAINIDVSDHKVSVFQFAKPMKTLGNENVGYKLDKDVRYYSKRYDKWVLAKAGLYDGATMAIDINSFSWLFHDALCNFGVFEDGSKCTNWQASMVLSDILRAENRPIRSFWWFVGTFVAGGGQARKNGLFKI